MRSPLATRKILWVDDNPDNILFEASYLEQLGATVSRVVSTKLALSHIARNETDLIISDLCRIEDGERRELAGLELLRQLQDHLKGTARTIAMVFYTGDRRRAPREISDRHRRARCALQVDRDHLARTATEQ